MKYTYPELVSPHKHSVNKSARRNNKHWPFSLNCCRTHRDRHIHFGWAKPATKNDWHVIYVFAYVHILLSKAHLKTLKRE